MNDRPRRLIPVFTLVLMAMSDGAALFSAEALAAPRLAEPVVLDQKNARDLLVIPVSPEYPPIARINYLQGNVRLQVQVSQEGNVTSAHVLKGNAILAAAALEAVRKWRYRPFRTASGPAEFLTNVEVKFTLQSRKNKAMPPHAEEDLSRQIRVPEIIGKPDASLPSSSVRLRVLVNEEGRAVDSELLSGPASTLSEARQVVDSWTFRPAHWGALAVPWYLEVDVPAGESFHPSMGPEVGSRCPLKYSP
jgi:TonB family protein